jgi:hypothetical protein
MILGLAIASLLSLPMEAQAAQYEFSDTRTGGFFGARFQVRLGGPSTSSPRAALTIAPTLSRTSIHGEIRSSIGEGIALNLGPRARPTLTLAGIRADKALGLQRDRDIDSGKKLGISNGGWVAIGVGVVALAGGIYFLHVLDEAKDNSD